MTADKMKRRVTRIVSSLTLGFFIFSQVTFAAPGIGIEMAVNREAPGFLRIDIPAELASLDGIWEAPPSSDSKVVLHIQNAHANYGAQKKIKELLEYLNKTYAIKTIFVEGAAEDLNPDYLKLFPDKARNLELADLLAQQGELTGAELYLLEQDSATHNAQRATEKQGSLSVERSTLNAPKAHGIEDAGLYRSNYEALKKVFGAEALVNSYLHGYESRLEALSSKIFTNDLRRVLTDWQKFEKGHREFMPYVRSLAADAKRILNLDLESLFSQVEWPQITRLLVLQGMEKELDTAQALAEKDKLLSFLKAKGVSPRIIAEVENFREQRLSVRQGQGDMMQPRDVLEALVKEAGPKGFYFRDYPAFSLYAGYLILKSELDAKGLFEEIKALFAKILDSLAVAPSQKTLLELYRDEELARKLLQLELSRRDWQQALGRKTEIQMDSLISRLKDVSAAVTQEMKLAPSDLEVKKLSPKFRDQVLELYTSAFSFYEFARQREAVFYEKISSVMARESLNKAVVITGGFHTDGMTDLLREHNVSYGILTPRLLEKSDEKLYRNTMLQNEKQLFSISYLELALKLQSFSDFNAQGFDPVKSLGTVWTNFMKAGRFVDYQAAIDVFNVSVAATQADPDYVLKLSLDEKNKNILKLERISRSEARDFVENQIVKVFMPKGADNRPFYKWAQARVVSVADDGIRYQVIESVDGDRMLNGAQGFVPSNEVGDRLAFYAESKDVMQLLKNQIIKVFMPKGADNRPLNKWAQARVVSVADDGIRYQVIESVDGDQMLNGAQGFIPHSEAKDRVGFYARSEAREELQEVTAAREKAFRDASYQKSFKLSSLVGVSVGQGLEVANFLEEIIDVKEEGQIDRDNLKPGRLNFDLYNNHEWKTLQQFNERMAAIGKQSEIAARASKLLGDNSHVFFNDNGWPTGMNPKLIVKGLRAYFDVQIPGRLERVSLPENVRISIDQLLKDLEAEAKFLSIYRELIEEARGNLEKSLAPQEILGRLQKEMSNPIAFGVSYDPSADEVRKAREGSAEANEIRPVFLERINAILARSEARFTDQDLAIVRDALTAASAQLDYSEKLRQDAGALSKAMDSMAHPELLQQLNALYGRSPSQYARTEGGMRMPDAFAPIKPILLAIKQRTEQPSVARSEARGTADVFVNGLPAQVQDQLAKTAEKILQIVEMMPALVLTTLAMDLQGYGIAGSLTDRQLGIILREGFINKGVGFEDEGLASRLEVEFSYLRATTDPEAFKGAIRKTVGVLKTSLDRAIAVRSGARMELDELITRASKVGDFLIQQNPWLKGKPSSRGFMEELATAYRALHDGRGMTDQEIRAKLDQAIKDNRQQIEQGQLVADVVENAGRSEARVVVKVLDLARTVENHRLKAVSNWARLTTTQQAKSVADLEQRMWAAVIAYLQTVQGAELDLDVAIAEAKGKIEITEDVMSRVADFKESANARLIVSGLESLKGEYQPEFAPRSEARVNLFDVTGLVGREVTLSYQDKNGQLQELQGMLTKAMAQPWTNPDGSVPLTVDIMTAQGTQELMLLVNTVSYYGASNADGFIKTITARSESRVTVTPEMMRDFSNVVEAQLTPKILKWLKTEHVAISADSLESLLGGIMLPADAFKLGAERVAQILTAYVTSRVKGQFSMEVFLKAIQDVVARNPAFGISNIPARTVKVLDQLPTDAELAALAIQLATNTGQEFPYVFSKDVENQSGWEGFKKSVEKIQAMQDALGNPIGNNRLSFKTVRPSQMASEAENMGTAGLGRENAKILLSNVIILWGIATMPEKFEGVSTLVRLDMGNKELAASQNLAGMKGAQTGLTLNTVPAELLKEFPGVFKKVEGGRYFIMDNQALLVVASLLQEMVAKAAVSVAA